MCLSRIMMLSEHKNISCVLHSLPRKTWITWKTEMVASLNANLPEFNPKHVAQDSQRAGTDLPSSISFVSLAAPKDGCLSMLGHEGSTARGWLRFGMHGTF